MANKLASKKLAVLGTGKLGGILELEGSKLRVTSIKAVVKATQGAGELLFEK